MNDSDEDIYLMPGLLAEVADQVPERMHLVWSDDAGRGGHPYRAVCGYNASVSLEWGRGEKWHEDDDLSPKGFETDWSKKYPDAEVWAQELDILLHGAVIYRFSIALVDGARCWIPFPSPNQGREGHHVTQWQASVVGLVNRLVHTDDTLEYLRRADIEIVDVPPVR